MFDWFEVKTVVLNAWFSHSYTEKIHSFSLPFDCWQTEPPVLSVVGISSTRQGSGHPSPHLRGWQWCLIQPEHPSSLPDRQSLLRMRQTPWPWEEVDTPVTSSLSKVHWGSFWKQCGGILTHSCLSCSRAQHSGGVVTLEMLLILAKDG